MSDLMQSALVGTISGVISSAMFFVLLFQLRPKMVIAPSISVTTNNRGEPVYWLKFVNRGRRDIMDLQCSLFLVCTEEGPGGRFNHREKLLSLTLPHLPRYRRKDETARYAYRLLGEGDILQLWPDGNEYWLMLLVVARDSVSGFSRSFRQEYRGKVQTLRRGTFQFGLSLNVEELVRPVPPAPVATS
jgi:hypothetical protein